jgi:hypothetical protein
MINSVEEFIKLRKSQNPEEYNRANDDFLPDDVAFDLIENYPEMREYVSVNSTISLKVLNRLADDEDWLVRLGVLEMHPFTGKKAHTLDRHLLDKLSKDEDESIRRRVSCHPDTPIDILERLIHDPSEDCVEFAKKNLARKLRKLKRT